MTGLLNTSVEKFKKIRIRRQRIVSVLCVLSLFVVLGVFWQLRIVGITMTDEASCGKIEHVHSEACIAEGQPVCGREEHVHTLSCYSNPNADVERQSDWEDHLPGNLSGDWPEDLVATARSQVGYRESKDNFELAEDESIRGYTRYGEWYGSPYGDWSAMFAAFCLHYAGIPEEAAPYNSGVGAMSIEWNDLGLLEGTDYIPDAGDLVFLDKNADGEADSVGIISQCETPDGQLYAIEGNSDDRVSENRYEPDDSAIVGYGSLAAARERAVKLGIIENPEEALRRQELLQDTNGVVSCAVATVRENMMMQAAMPLAADETGSIADYLTVVKLIVDGVEYDGTTPLNPQKEFSIHLEWDLFKEDFLTAGYTYTYDFPEGIVVNDVAEQPLVNSLTGKIVGSYAIENGILIVSYNKTYEDITTEFDLNAKWDLEKTDQITEIPWNDELNTKVQFEKSKISVTKKKTSVEDAADGSLIALYEIEVKSRGNVENIILTDTMTSTSGKIKFCPKYFTDDSGTAWDYRYRIGTDGIISEIYQYGNFPDESYNEDGTVKESIRFPEFDLKNGEKCNIEYAVRIDADDRLGLDFEQKEESLTNTAAGSYVENGETFGSSVTIEDTYKTEHETITKRKGHLTDEGTYQNTDIPWKISVNPDMVYYMGGALVKDTVLTEGMFYKTDGPFRVTVTRPNGETAAENKTWIMLSDKTVGDIQAAGGKAGEWLFTPEGTDALNEMNQAVGKTITLDNISDYVFVNESKSSFIWFISKETDEEGNEIPCSYDLEYMTDISGVEDFELKNSVRAAWEKWRYEIEVETSKTAVVIEKGNDGVYIDSLGRYLVDWTIDIFVPADRDALAGVYLYDNLQSYDTKKGLAVDWLMGLSADSIDCQKFEDLAYQNGLTRSAFTITTDSEDAEVQAVVKNATTGLGHPLDGIRDEYQVYEETNASLGQLKLLDGGTDGYNGKRMSPTWFGVNLGTLPSTRGKDGYAITVKYTTRVNPQIILELKETPSVLRNDVELRQRIDEEDETLCSANAKYWLLKKNVGKSIAKQVDNYDPDTGIITYQVMINPKCNLPAEKVAYQVDDMLALEGAEYIDKSFSLTLLGTVDADMKFTYDPAKQTVLWKSDGSLTPEDGGLTQQQIDAIKWNYISFFQKDAVSGSDSFTFEFRNYMNIFEVEREGKKYVAPMVLTYRVQLPENTDGDIPQTNIQNTASLLKNGENSTVFELIDKVTNDFDFDSPLYKILSGNPDSENGYCAEFTIDIDTNDPDWPEELKDGEFTVIDTMSKTLQLLLDTIRVYGIAENGTQTELPASAYTAFYDAYDAENNVLYVTIEKQEAYEKYRLVYEARVTGNIGTDVSYENVAEVEGTGIVSEKIEKVVRIQKQDGITAGTYYEVVLYKYDADNIFKPLAATFELYAYDETENQWKLRESEKPLTTGEDGRLVINSDNSDLLTGNTWYKLVEISSPSGYIGKDIYFYLTNLKHPEEKAPPEGVTDGIVFPGMEGKLYIPNFKTALQLRKVDAKNSDITLRGAEFALYDNPNCMGEPLRTSLEEKDKNGIYSFDLTGLKIDTTYYLKETKAPDGYMIDDSVYTVTFDNKGNVTLKDADGNEVDSIGNAYPIPNESGYKLPEAGGTGTLLYLLCGILLMAAPLVYGFRLRQKHGRRTEL